jgi:hypothetical protein
VPPCGIQNVDERCNRNAISLAFRLIRIHAIDRGNLAHLTAFVAVVDRLSFRAAAPQLRVNRTAATYRLQMPVQAVGTVENGVFDPERSLGLAWILLHSSAVHCHAGIVTSSSTLGTIMATFFYRAAATAVVSLLFLGSAFAQTTTPATPPPAGKAVPAPKMAPAEKKTEKPRTAVSLQCSTDADAKGIHGEERKNSCRSARRLRPTSRSDFSIAVAVQPYASAEASLAEGSGDIENCPCTVTRTVPKSDG